MAGLFKYQDNAREDELYEREMAVLMFIQQIGDLVDDAGVASQAAARVLGQLKDIWQEREYSALVKEAAKPEHDELIKAITDERKEKRASK